MLPVSRVLLYRAISVVVDLNIVDHYCHSVLNHFGIFESLFKTEVFFNNAQRMKISYGNDVVYLGNILPAEVTGKFAVYLFYLGFFKSFITIFGFILILVIYFFLI